MRIIVFSDTHGNFDGCIKVLINIIDVDMVLHAGDHIKDAQRLEAIFPDIPFFYVPGNCDYSEKAQDLIITAEGKQIFLTHGHAYAVKYEYDYMTITNAAKEKGCALAVFGHTHLPLCDLSKEVGLLNPGSTKSSITYGVIEIENGILKAAVCPL